MQRMELRRAAETAGHAGPDTALLKAEGEKAPGNGGIAS
jgi:hypothetical protein